MYVYDEHCTYHNTLRYVQEKRNYLNKKYVDSFELYILDCFAISLFPLPLLQLISQLVEDVYYSCEDTPQSTANEGLLSLAYGQSVEVLDASGGDLWLVKTTDTASGKTSEGLVQRFWLTPKPPPPRENVTLVQNGTEPHPPHQNGDTGMSELQPGRDTDRVQLRGHPLPTSSAPAAVLPGTLFGVYEPPKSMIFGKPEVNEGDIPVIEDSIKISTPTTKQVPPMILEQAPTPHKSEEEAKTATAADDELQRLQVASVNSQVQLDNFDPVEMYVAIADFDAAEDSNISLRAGEHVQVSQPVGCLQLCIT